MLEATCCLTPGCHGSSPSYVTCIYIYIYKTLVLNQLYFILSKYIPQFLI